MVSGFTKKEIKPTKTVGQRLRDARRRKELSLEKAERLTKVKLKYLKALEEDRHDVMPTEVYSLGFLRCYAEVLGLNPKKIMEQYQAERQALTSAKGQITPHLAPSRAIAAPRFAITPRTLFSVLSIIVVLGLMVYIVSGVRSFLAPPELTIDEPKPDSRVQENSLTVAGKTDPTASLTINGELITVSPDGEFEQKISVAPGLNSLEFLAVNRVGKEAKLSRKILADYKVTPPPTPSSSPAASPVASPTATVSPRPTVSPST